MKKLSVLMPVYNEVHSLRQITARVFASPVAELDVEIELVIVDDGSTDGSRALADELAAADSRVKVVLQGHNRGKSAAIARAIQEATGEFAIIQDADLEYDPNDYPALITPLLRGRADAVYGSRFAGPGRRGQRPLHRLANRLLTWLSNQCTNLRLTDMETCYKAVRLDLLRRIRITSARFSLEPELTAKLARLRARIHEVPIRYRGRSYLEGKKITWLDGLAAIWAIFKYRFWAS